MDDLISNTLNSYFNAIHTLGYIKYKDVYKILFIMMVLEFLYGDFKDCITIEDSKLLNNLVSNLYGTSCLIPYPNNCNKCLL